MRFSLKATGDFFELFLLFSFVISEHSSHFFTFPSVWFSKFIIESGDSASSADFEFHCGKLFAMMRNPISKFQFVISILSWILAHHLVLSLRIFPFFFLESCWDYSHDCQTLMIFYAMAVFSAPFLILFTPILHKISDASRE